MAARVALLVAPLFLAGCLSHPPPPEAPYHAVGADGRWHLVIDDKHVTFLPAGGQPIREPRPQPIIGVAGEIYQTPRIDVNIVHGRCVIGDRAYPDSVQVTADSTQYAGCGGDPGTASGSAADIDLAGTHWQVALVNGRPTPAVGDYSMRFMEDGSFGARFGCNHMGGRYRVTGSTLALSDVATTLIGCPEPAGTFESEAALVMAAPMQVQVAEGGRVVLRNAAGSLSLTPQA